MQNNNINQTISSSGNITVQMWINPWLKRVSNTYTAKVEQCLCTASNMQVQVKCSKLFWAHPLSCALCLSVYKTYCHVQSAHQIYIYGVCCSTHISNNICMYVTWQHDPQMPIKFDNVCLKREALKTKVEEKRGSVTEMAMSRMVPGKRPIWRPRKRWSDEFWLLPGCILCTPYLYNYTLFNICITTPYKRLSIHEPYLQLLCIRICMNDPRTSGDVF